MTDLAQLEQMEDSTLMSEIDGRNVLEGVLQELVRKEEILWRQQSHHTGLVFPSSSVLLVVG